MWRIKSLGVMPMCWRDIPKTFKHNKCVKVVVLLFNRRHKESDSLGVRAHVHMVLSVYSCERERDRGLFRRPALRSSYWVQTARLLHRLGAGPPGSQRKVPFLVSLKLNCGHGPCNLETQLLIYQHTNYIRYSLSHCRHFERLHCDTGKPLAS